MWDCSLEGICEAIESLEKCSPQSCNNLIIALESNLESETLLVGGTIGEGVSWVYTYICPHNMPYPVGAPVIFFTLWKHWFTIFHITDMADTNPKTPYNWKHYGENICVAGHCSNRRCNSSVSLLRFHKDKER